MINSLEQQNQRQQEEILRLKAILSSVPGSGISLDEDAVKYDAVTAALEDKDGQERTDHGEEKKQVPFSSLVLTIFKNCAPCCVGGKLRPVVHCESTEILRRSNYLVSGFKCA
jgi:hypothetical protein